MTSIPIQFVGREYELQAINRKHSLITKYGCSRTKHLRSHSRLSVVWERLHEGRHEAGNSKTFPSYEEGSLSMKIYVLSILLYPPS